MLRTVQFACTLPKTDADALNRESGRIYTDMLVRHYRVYRRQGVWLTRENGERLEDTTSRPYHLACSQSGRSPTGLLQGL